MDIVPERVLPSNRLANGDVPLHGVANFREFEVKKIFVSRNLKHKKLVNSCQDDRLTRFYKVDA